MWITVDKSTKSWTELYIVANISHLNFVNNLCINVDNRG